MIIFWLLLFHAEVPELIQFQNHSPQQWFIQRKSPYKSQTAWQAILRIRRRQSSARACYVRSPAEYKSLADPLALRSSKDWHVLRVCTIGSKRLTARLVLPRTIFCYKKYNGRYLRRSITDIIARYYGECIYWWNIQTGRSRYLLVPGSKKRVNVPVDEGHIVDEYETRLIRCRTFLFPASRC
jgi:hypothetical protein